MGRNREEKKKKKQETNHCIMKMIDLTTRIKQYIMKVFEGLSPDA